jgi:hypothetical protein
MLLSPPPFRPGVHPLSLLCRPSSLPATISPLGLAFAAASVSEMELHICLRLHARLPPAVTPPPAPFLAPAVLPASRRLRTGKDCLSHFSVCLGVPRRSNAGPLSAICVKKFKRIPIGLLVDATTLDCCLAGRCYYTERDLILLRLVVRWDLRGCS